MASTLDSGESHGTNGAPQTAAEESKYPDKVEANEASVDTKKPPIYSPSPKHDVGGWGSRNPIKMQSEGQHLLESGYKHGKQVYNITNEGVIVKFQPDNSPNNSYHSYEVSKNRDIPSEVLKKMFNDGKLTRAEYNKFRKGKK